MLDFLSKPIQVVIIQVYFYSGWIAEEFSWIEQNQQFGSLIYFMVTPSISDAAFVPEVQGCWA